MAARRLLATMLATALTGATGAADVLHFELLAASETVYAEPHDIVLSGDGRRLYVADNGNDRVAVLDARSLTLLGTIGERELNAPHDVVFDAAGRLLVADTGNHRIAIYKPEGSSWRLDGQLRERLRSPEGVAVHADGRVFATGAGSNNLVVFRDARVQGEVGGFSSPHDVEFDAAGAAWVADAGNDRLVQLDEELRFARVLSGAPYGFNGPRYLDFDQAGRMLVADKYANSIKIIAPDGQLLQVLGGPRSGLGAGVFDRPEGVEVRGADVWFADTYNDRIVRYRMRPGS